MIATAHNTHKPSHQETAMQAYFLWEKNGRPWGEEEAFWFQAERILWDRIEAKQWRDEEEVQAVAKKVAATTKPGSSRAKAKASTKPLEASAPTEKKAQAGCSQKGKLHGFGNAHQSFHNSEEGGRSKDDRQSKEAQQSKRFQADSIDSRIPRESSIQGRE